MLFGELSETAIDSAQPGLGGLGFLVLEWEREREGEGETAGCVWAPSGLVRAVWVPG